MPWYKAGTVSVTQNSNAVVGSGTAFIANSRVGDAFLGPDGKWYEVTNIASDTALSISPNYQGATSGAGVYALAPLQGYVKASADALRSLVNKFGGVLAVLGEDGTLAGVRTALNLSDTGGLTEGANRYFTEDRVRATPAKGLSTSDGAAVVATDTFLAAIGKLQAQSNGKEPSFPAGTIGQVLRGNKSFMNIVGTVTQSGGVPTGAIMEAGAFPSGRYFRFSGGFQVCLGTLTFSGSGAGTRSVAWSFPASFNTPPSIFGSLASYGTVARYIGCSGGNVPDAFGAPDISITVTDASAGAITVNVIAAGRWHA